MQADRPADVDRLPWLEPYREARPPARRSGRRSRGGLVALIAALVLMPIAVAAGYWLGQRSAPPVPRPPSTIVPLPDPRPAPALPTAPPLVQAPATPPAAAPQPAPKPAAEPPAQARSPAVKRPKPAKKAIKRRSGPRKTIRSAGTQRPSYNAVRARQERLARARPWPKMPSPGPAGQVIQLGAFSTPARAYAAYRVRIARYPTLARMPRVVVPVITKPDGRVLYVLRLGTTSRQHSTTVCRNLRRSGDHCLVIG